MDSIVTSLRWLAKLVVYWLGGLVPRKNDQLVFGAWRGARYADNSKYLLEYMADECPDLTLIWCGHQGVEAAVPVRDNVVFVRYGSLRSYWACLRSGAGFVSHGFSDLAPVNLMRGAASFYLGHGLAIKNMGAGTLQDDGQLKNWLRTQWLKPKAIDYWSASSDEHSEKLHNENQRALIADAQILRTGQPRLDPLFTSTQDPTARAAIRAGLRERHGLPEDALLISYLPTFRDSGKATRSFAQLQGDEATRLNQLLERHDAWLAEKNHAAEATAGGQTSASSTRLLDFGSDKQLDTQELLIATDIIITDYSGCYIDFLITDRPVIHYAYDYDTYRTADRGMYFSLEDVGGGDVVADFDALLEALETALEDPRHGAERRAALRSRLLTWEAGTSRSETAAFVRAALSGSFGD